MTTTTDTNFFTEENVAYNVTARGDNGNTVLENYAEYATVNPSLSTV